MRETKSRIKNIINGIDSNIKLIALVILIVEAITLAALPTLDQSDRLPVIAASLLLLLVVAMGAFVSDRLRMKATISETTRKGGKSSLENLVPIFYSKSSAGDPIKGIMINSRRLLDRYLEHERNDLRLGDIQLLIPSDKAIDAAYDNKPPQQKERLMKSISEMQEDWGKLEARYVGKVTIKRIDSFPTNIYVIGGSDNVVSGLYEPDPVHPIGMTCSISWLIEDSGDAATYLHWFNTLWNQAK